MQISLQSTLSLLTTKTSFLIQRFGFKRHGSSNQVCVSVPVPRTQSISGLAAMFALMKINLLAALSPYLMAGYLHPFKSPYHHWTSKS